MNNKIQLYSLATPNGQKVSIALEEMEIPYDAHLIDIRNGDQFSDKFISINPNSKIPAIVDPDGPKNKPHNVMESAAILLYLAQKSGKLFFDDPVLKSEGMQWLFFQMASIGPMFGQFGHFYRYGAEKCDHPYPVARYGNEVKRLLGVLDKHLDKKTYMVGDSYSIVDIAIFPWVDCLDKFYEAKEFLGVDSFKNVMNWFKRCMERPAVQRGMVVCGW